MFVHHSNLEEAQKDARKLVCYDCGVACDMTQMRDERLVYLRKLGAEKPRVVEAKVEPTKVEPTKVEPTKVEPTTESLPLSADGAPLPKAPPQKPAKRRPPASFPQGEPRRYRFAFTKVGPAGFLSHLDLIRALPRAFRRCELPLYYSQGFHPKPDLMFGPALSLGVFSAAEYMDAKITADIDPASFLDALSEGSGEGVTFLRGIRLDARDLSLPKVVDAVEYVLALSRIEVGALGGEAWVNERIATFLARTETPIVRRIERIGKSVNVRSFVDGISFDQEGAKELEAAGLRGTVFPVRVRVANRPNGSAKISEVASVVFGQEVPFFALRTQIGRAQGSRIISPLSLEELRIEEVRPVAAAEPRAEEIAVQI